MEFGEGLVHAEDGWRVIAAEIDHDRSIKCFGLRFEIGSKVVTVSGDTAYCQAIVDLARGADILVHECSFYLPPGADPALAASGAYWRRRKMLEEHAGPREAARVARDAGAKKLALTHMTPTVEREGALAQCAEEFSGEVYFGEDLLVVTA